jgi:hypothetical protein
VCTSERLDPHIVFPLCIFGCDFLHEQRFVLVRDRKVVSFGKVTLSEAEKAAASALLGKTLKPPWSSGPPAYFADV